MDSRILVIFAGTGLALGIASLFTLPWSFGLLWVVALVGWVVLLRQRRASWASAAVGGFLAGLFTGLAQSILQSEYLARHPADAATVAGKSAVQIGLQFTLFALVAGLVWGLLAWGISWMIARRSRNTETTNSS